MKDGSLAKHSEKSPSSTPKNEPKTDTRGINSSPIASLKRSSTNSLENKPTPNSPSLLSPERRARSFTEVTSAQSNYTLENSSGFDSTLDTKSRKSSNVNVDINSDKNNKRSNPFFDLEVSSSDSDSQDFQANSKLPDLKDLIRSSPSSSPTTISIPAPSNTRKPPKKVKIHTNSTQKRLPNPANNNSNNNSTSKGKEKELISTSTKIGPHSRLLTSPKPVNSEKKSRFFSFSSTPHSEAQDTQKVQKNNLQQEPPSTSITTCNDTNFEDNHQNETDVNIHTRPKCPDDDLINQSQNKASTQISDDFQSPKRNKLTTNPSSVLANYPDGNGEKQKYPSDIIQQPPPPPLRFLPQDCEQPNNQNTPACTDTSLIQDAEQSKVADTEEDNNNNIINETTSRVSKSALDLLEKDLEPNNNNNYLNKHEGDVNNIKVGNQQESKILYNLHKALHREAGYGDDNNEDEDTFACSICLEPWTNKGKHQIVSLRCGHFFGYQCIKKWISSKQSAIMPSSSSSSAINTANTASNNNNRFGAFGLSNSSRDRPRVVGGGSSSHKGKGMMEKAKCPECNVISMKRDIRKHVLRKIIGTEGDEEEKAQLRSELEEYKIKCAKLQLLERTSNKKYEAVVKEMMRLREQLDVAGNVERQLKEQISKLEAKAAYSHNRDGNNPDIEIEPADQDVKNNEDHNIDDDFLDINDLYSMDPHFESSSDLLEHKDPMERQLELNLIARINVIESGDKNTASTNSAGNSIGNMSEGTARVIVVHPNEPLIYISISKRILDQQIHTFALIDCEKICSLNTTSTSNLHNSSLILKKLHSGTIRGASIRPYENNMPCLLLSAGMDKKAVITNIDNPAQHFTTTEFDVGVAIFSCQWDPINKNQFYLGCQGSKVYSFDLKSISSSSDIHDDDYGNSPVHVWDCAKAGFDNPQHSVHYSPIHSIVTINIFKGSRFQSKNDQIRTKRLVLIANSKYICLLPTPEDPNDDDGGKKYIKKPSHQLQQKPQKPKQTVDTPWQVLVAVKPGTDCFSLAYDAESDVLLASFRRQSLANRSSFGSDDSVPYVSHQLFKLSYIDSPTPPYYSSSNNTNSKLDNEILSIYPANIKNTDSKDKDKNLGWWFLTKTGGYISKTPQTQMARTNHFSIPGRGNNTSDNSMGSRSFVCAGNERESNITIWDTSSVPSNNKKECTRTAIKLPSYCSNMVVDLKGWNWENNIPLECNVPRSLLAVLSGTNLLLYHVVSE